VKTILSVCFLFIFLFSARGQFTNIMIDDVGNPEEPSIAINPQNTNEVVAGANIDNQYYSHDAGHTWTKQTLVSSWGVWGDPCIVTDTSGRFYFFHLSYTNGPNGWIDRIVCQRSDDAGITWPLESYTGLDNPKDEDKAWAVYDGNPVSAYKGTMYVTWTQFDAYGSTGSSDRSRILFSKSTDHGLTWSSPQTISQFTGDCIDSDNTAEGAVPAIGANGEVYVSWSLNDTIYFDRSTDGGQTWLATDLIVSTQPGGWDYSIAGHDRANGLPVTATDLSGGPYHGTIYVNWSDQRNGTFDTDVWLAKSTDSGNTWSLPVRVNNDAAGRQNYLCWMTVDQATGVVYFVFYDRRNFSSSSLNTDVYMAYSTDGGNTFTNVKISSSFFIPTASQFFGDYTNISAYNGIVRPVWARMTGGASSVWTAIVDYPTGINSADYFSLHAELKNFPNPFSETTSIAFNSAVRQKLSLQLTDITGRKIAAIFRDKAVGEGAVELEFDNNKYKLPPGIYVLELSNARYKEVAKMCIVK
jgi:type IX secretion system substrate protein/BNR/Asp-box repeat protein